MSAALDTAYAQAGVADRLWFCEHPRRRFRLRPIVEAERVGLDAPSASHVVVEKVTSWMRRRRAVLILGEVPDVDRVLERFVRDGFVQIGARAAA